MARHCYIIGDPGGRAGLSLCHLNGTDASRHPDTPVHWGWPVQRQFVRKLRLIQIFQISNMIPSHGNFIYQLFIRYGTSVQSVKDVAAQGKYIYFNTLIPFKALLTIINIDSHQNEILNCRKALHLGCIGQCHQAAACGPALSYCHLSQGLPLASLSDPNPFLFVVFLAPEVS